MSYTSNYGLPKMPMSLTDPAAVYNAAVDMIERGRTRLCVASGTVLKGHAVTILADGKYRHAEPGDTFHGVADADAVDGVQFFAVSDVGVEITLDSALFTVGSAVYIGDGGELVQAFSGYARIGIATASNKVVLLASGFDDFTALVNAILVGHGLITE